MTNTICEKCTGDGTIFVTNGPDDTEEQFCTCERGQELKLEAERLTAHND
tara:strand:+ start:2429 stop:2578 length:150 start_codon:yes stop_codon:yes gene_type:complete